MKRPRGLVLRGRFVCGLENLLRRFVVSRVPPPRRTRRLGDPPPGTWEEVTCFLYYTAHVALQNIHRKEVSRRFFYQLELGPDAVAAGWF